MRPPPPLYQQFPHSHLRLRQPHRYPKVQMAYGLEHRLRPLNILLMSFVGPQRLHDHTPMTRMVCLQ